MKKLLAIASLCLPLSAQSSPIPQMKMPSIDKAHTVMRSHHNEETLSPFLFTRRTDVPTQIVRVEGDIDEEDLTCDDALDIIDDFFTDSISYEHFYYNTIMFCNYDPQSKNASHFLINSYFEPTTDEGIEILKDYKETHNNQPLFNTPFKMEEAQGIVISLNVAAGMSGKDVFTRIRQDRANYIFKNHHELTQNLISDIYKHVYSHSPQVILPFFKKWVFDFADKVYYGVLTKSDYIEVEPEKMFLMADEPKIFTSMLKYYYASNCQKYSNHHCL